MGLSCAKSSYARRPPRKLPTIATSAVPITLTKSSLICSDSRKRNPFNLCPHEVAVIHRSWDVAKSNEIGTRTVVSILAKRPHFTSYFGLEPSTADELAIASPVIYHARKLTDFLDGIIRSLDTTKTLDDEHSIRCMIQSIGTMHFHKGVNFTAGNWLLFKRVLLEEICRPGGVETTTTTTTTAWTPKQRRKSRQAGNAWDKLLRFVVAEMKRGFLEQALKNNNGESDDNSA